MPIRSVTCNYIIYNRCEIAEMVGISPASITIFYKEIMKSGYLLEKYDDSKRLLRKRELLQRWVTGYQETLRPKLLIGAHQTVKEGLVRNFTEQPIEDSQG